MCVNKNRMLSKRQREAIIKHRICKGDSLSSILKLLDEDYCQPEQVNSLLCTSIDSLWTQNIKEIVIGILGIFLGIFLTPLFYNILDESSLLNVVPCFIFCAGIYGAIRGFVRLIKIMRIRSDILKQK